MPTPPECQAARSTGAVAPDREFHGWRETEVSDNLKEDKDVALERLAGEIRAEAEVLRGEVARLSKRLAHVERSDAGRASVTSSPDVVSPASISGDPGEDRLVSRRGALRALGGLAAGGVGLAAGATLLGAEPAAAANGDPVLMGQGNQSHDSTQVETDVGWGWIGSTSDPTSTGVGGAWGLDASQVGGFGVLGESTRGTGVYGQSVGSSGLSGFHKISGVIGDNNSGEAGVTGLCDGGALSWGVHGMAGSGTGEIPNGSAGVFGESGDAGGVGLYGVSIASDGIQGYAVGTGAGVRGTGASSGGAAPGVPVGVLGESGQGYGVYGASSGSIGVVAVGGSVPLLLTPATTAIGPPTSGDHLQGEIFVDAGSGMFLCTGRGSPGVWRQIITTAPGYNDNNAGIGGSLGPAGSVNLLASPIRVLDTRPGQPQPTPAQSAGGHGPRTAAENPTVVQITAEKVGTISVPGRAVGVMGNVSVVSPAGPGDLRIYPSGTTVPLAANIVYAQGVTISNFCVVGLNGSGQMSIHVDGGATDIVFDVTGFIF